jgi:zinc transport system substrate-binding protein
MKKHLILLFIFLTAASACGSKPAPENKFSVVVSIFPIYDALKNIAGSSADIISAVPAGSDPHSYEPAPSTVRKIASANLCVIVADELDGWIKKSASPGTPVLTLSGDSRLMDDHNPHFWVSPPLMIIALEKITAIMSRLDPSGEAAYNKGFAAYRKQLEALDKKIDDRLKNLKHRSFVQWHPAWDAYAVHYGLKISASVEGGHGKAPSLRELARIIGLAKSSGARVLVSDPRAPETPAASFVKETGGSLVLLDPLGGSGIGYESYIETMMTNTEKLAEALE